MATSSPNKLEVISTKETTDEGHGRNYSAKHEITTIYKHPKDISFKHVHIDGKDYEDSYKNEIVTIGNLEVNYYYDLGNYFLREYISVKEDGKQISFAEQSHGAVDPLKTDTKEKEQGKLALERHASELTMSYEDFLKLCSSKFKMNIDVLKLF